MKQVNWFDRKFDFSNNNNTMPAIIERLEGTAIQLLKKAAQIEPQRYTIKPDGKWSILQHIGHLTDLETLWQERLADILNGEKELRPADLQNTKTTQANHNTIPIMQLIANFDAIRNVTLGSLKQLAYIDVFKSSLHPRLKTPMRTIDLFTFVAAHDDHHLARISAIAQGH